AARIQPFGRSARPFAFAGGAANGQAQCRHCRHRGGGQLRRAASIQRWPRQRHLLLGFALRSGRTSGGTLERLSRAARSGRLRSRNRPRLRSAEKTAGACLRQALKQGHDMSDTHFGFKTVAEEEKAKRVAGVFSSVAQKYDVMNDLMSA